MRRAVNLWVSPVDLLEGFSVSKAALMYFTGRSTYDFEKDQHGFRFEECSRFPVHKDGEIITAVTKEELEKLVHG